MKSSVDKCDFKVDYRVSSHDSVEGSLGNAVERRFDVLLWYGTANDFVLLLYTFALFIWLELNDCMTILPSPT